jgi:cobalamin biosynthesis Mg chelatase CobN
MMNMSMAEERIDYRESVMDSEAEQSDAGGEKHGAGERAKSKGEAVKKRRPGGVRVLLWLLRKSIVPLIMVIMLVTGLYVGYVIVGKGPEEDVFVWQTWRHLYDLVFADS